MTIDMAMGGTLGRMGRITLVAGKTTNNMAMGRSLTRTGRTGKEIG